MDASPNNKPCLLCDAPMEALGTPKEVPCIFCGERESVLLSCPDAHHICDCCRSQDVRLAIETMAQTTGLTDPIRIAELMMGHPRIGMLDCDHTFIAAGAFMAALKNSPYGSKITDNEVREVLDRTARQTTRESCAQTGVCGIVPAMGACVALFLDVRFGSDREQQITMDAVTNISQALTDQTGPICCKAYVRVSISVASTFFAERFGILLPTSRTAVVCRSSEKHPFGCREGKCVYYLKPARDIFVDAIHLPRTVCRS